MCYILGQSKTKQDSEPQGKFDKGVGIDLSDKLLKTAENSCVQAYNNYH